MREKAIWAVLHKSWEDSMKNDRLLKTIPLLTTGEQIWSASEPELTQQFPEIPAEVWQCFVRRRARTDLSKVESYLNLQQIEMIWYSHPQYPAALREIALPPAFLYWKGNLAPWELPTADLNIAIVGSRKADQYGLTVAEQLGSELSRAGVCVVSGLARGVDARAHWGALKGDAGTIAVQGCGIDQIYPKENAKLAEAILNHQRGCIVTEFALGSPPQAWHFPKRNRIISGLSRGVVIVQAAVKSGAFITIETALEQGRDVFAVPGQITNPLSAGPNRFLQEGAKLVTNANDILEEYGYQPQSLFPDLDTKQKRKTKPADEAVSIQNPLGQCEFQKKSEKKQGNNKKTANEKNESAVNKNNEPVSVPDIPLTVSLTTEESRVLQNITAEPITIEELAYLCKLPMAQLMPILSMLELYGCVQQLIGRNYIRIG